MPYANPGGTLQTTRLSPSKSCHQLKWIMEDRRGMVSEASVLRIISGEG